MPCSRPTLLDQCRPRARPLPAGPPRGPASARGRRRSRSPSSPRCPGRAPGRCASVRSRLHLVEPGDGAVVHPQPAAVAERVAVRLLHRRARRGADVGEHERDVMCAGDFPQVAVVPGRLDALEHARASSPSPYQPTPKPSPFVVVAPSRECRLWSISECFGRQQVLEQDGRPRIREPAAHAATLPAWRRFGASERRRRVPPAA